MQKSRIPHSQVRICYSRSHHASRAIRACVAGQPNTKADEERVSGIGRGWVGFDRASLPGSPTLIPN